MKKNYQRKTCLFAILLLLLVFTSFYLPVNADNDEYAYIGGEIVGFEADIGGALVTSSQNFDSGEWSVKPIFLPGDVIKSINGCRVYRVDDIAEILNGDDFPENNIAEVEFLRGGNLFCERITAGYGKNDNKRVLGVTAKDCVCGLGTMTFVRGDGSFAALGHAISDYDTGFNLFSKGGKIVEATVSGIDKSGRGAPGTIKGYLCSKRIGMIEKSGKFGIIGRITQSEPREEYKAKLGDVCTLVGDLGVGKTVLTQGIAEGLGITEPINSPTFTIVQVYEEGRLPFYHFDVYRIGDIEEMDEIGYEDYFYGDGLTMIEWANLIEEILPKKRKEITIEKDLEKGFDYRKITIKEVL